MPKTHVLFSANSRMAYVINRRYYGDYHYVYATSKFGCAELEPTIEANPSSSSPMTIYRSLEEESQSGDQQGRYITANRAGLLIGVEAKYEAGVINERQRDELHAIINEAGANLFSPIMYIIPYDLVEDMLISVSPDDRPHALSEEWKIEELPGDCFKPIKY